jgi:hypothetical protein
MNSVRFSSPVSSVASLVTLPLAVCPPGSVEVTVSSTWKLHSISDQLHLNLHGGCDEGLPIVAAHIALSVRSRRFLIIVIPDSVGDDGLTW